MNHIVSRAVILSRVNYGEADRILTLLTPDHGKVSLMAKGVRRVKSKLAGGIELFCVSEVTYIQGKSGGMGTLTSARLLSHYDTIVSDLTRTTLGYEMLRLVHKTTEDDTTAAHFALIEHSFKALANLSVPVPLVAVWFGLQLMIMDGQGPNLLEDSSGQQLEPNQTYTFDIEHMAFVSHSSGRYGSQHIKLLRLIAEGTSPLALSRIEGITQLASECRPAIEAMLGETFRV